MSQLSAVLGGIGVNPQVVILDNFIGSKSVILILVAHVD